VNVRLDFNVDGRGVQIPSFAAHGLLYSNDNNCLTAWRFVLTLGNGGTSKSKNTSSNGYGDVYSRHGFYSDDNPDGLTHKTDLFMLRTGVDF
jgi:hypothetical protein